MNVPQHVAIILDGNGRWAKAKGMPRNYGHAQGSKNVERICEEAWRMGIKYLTVYAFSTENWNRPDDEVNALMKLLRNYMKTCLKTAAKNDMKVRVIGDITRLDEDIQKRILELEEATKNNGGLNFQIAINYGSRDEMIRAIRKIAKDCVDGKVDPAEIKEETFEQYLDTKGIPDPDLMIRTSGELRLSNYLLWQLAYTEFYFTDVPWPDFSKEELEKAQKFLSGYPELTGQLSKAARAKRVNQHTNPAYRWVALAIVLAGAAALVYGIISWRNGGDFGMYFALFGFAAIFFFSGAHVLPTAKNNKKAVARAWEEAQANLAHVLPDDFPLPARYAHPVVLTRMIRILREGRAQSADEALEVLKSDLKALNADVQVSQEEYDEVVAIKSMFLLSDYQ